MVGNGMVGHRFLEAMIAGGHHRALRLVTFCEEPRLAYDRVRLSSFMEGTAAAALSLVAPGQYEEAGVEVHVGDRVTAIDRAGRTVTSARGRVLRWDKLVLATGSTPFVPPVPGRDARGCFTYRTIEDLEAIRAYAATARTGVVVGGGLLGLEAAHALQLLGLAVHVVELAPRLMALQVDETGGALLAAKIAATGVTVHTGRATTRIAVGDDGCAAGLVFADGGALAADLVVFSAGIRPRDELARACGLAVGDRGGIIVDERCQTSDPDIHAIGECALAAGRLHGLVAPGYRMAEVAVSALTGGAETFVGGDPSAKLKLLGVDVASFGDAFAARPGARVLSWLDTTSGVYKRLVVSSDGGDGSDGSDGSGRLRLTGGVLVGDATSYPQLVALAQSGGVLPPHPEDLLLPPRAGAASAASAGFGVDALPDSALICSCQNVSKQAICDAIGARQLTEIAAVKACTRAGTGCGSCVPLVTELLAGTLARAGVAVTNHLCEHFAFSRQDLVQLVRVHELRTFEALLARHGSGHGCEICKPAVASILASVWNEHVLARSHLPLQDTNDRFLANIQRDGTYSVVPRVPAGEITPDQLIALGRVAKRHGLYTKITGGQRVDLLGARVEQLPAIWRELIAAGFESGHAYGKALRTVKSCVGSTWCRYGVQDSVSLALRLEHRYKGLRSPHKIKGAVSGCARECAEAQGKDFGVIATERGYNLYLGGNGGMRPQHAQLFATDLDEDTVVRYLDRFFMFYVRTADRLQRTATWLNKLAGGIDYLRQVLIDDSLGLCAELEAEMAAITATYQCEWKAALGDPAELARFQPFVNTPRPDPSIVVIRQRLQHRPADWDERAPVVAALVEEPT